MPIEQELREAYKRSANMVMRPEQLDARISRQYAVQSIQKHLKKRASKKTWAIRIIVACVLLTSVGFSAPYLFQLKDKLIEYNVLPNRMNAYDNNLAEQVRESIDLAKQEMQIGERGLYYSDNLKKLLPKTKLSPFLLITKPYVWEDQREWEEELTGAADLHLPGSLTDSLTFIGGQKEQPFGGFLSLDDMAFVKELELRSQERQRAETWMLLPKRAIEEFVFTTMYESEADNRINITMEVFRDKTTIQMLSDFNEQEQIRIGDQPATFVHSENFLFSNTDQYRALSWLDSRERDTVMYTVGSPAEDMTKLELIHIAEQFIK
ncbi:hypothetical protein [Candidatus Pristimantibacillus sp. PTI5]|uniref:hypothetical protein n=1 Tax=Candidatus Pristimantibacillus sp. PTI5 TaxID=3400422 RepID=UPI003B017249